MKQQEYQPQPVTVIERQKAGQALLQLLNRVPMRQPANDLSEEEQEDLIAKEVKAFRKAKPRRHA